jgi:hypothetical protein
MILHRKWFSKRVLLMIVALGISGLITYQYVSAKKMLADLQARAAVLDQVPLKRLETRHTLKPGLASTHVSYVTELSFPEVRAIFVPILERDGWHVLGQRHIKRWGSFSDIDEIQLHRGSTCAGTCAGVYYSNSLNEVWFIATWTMEGCSDE